MSLLKRRKIIDGPNSRVVYAKNISSFAKVSKTAIFTYKKDVSDSEGERPRKLPCKAPVQSKKRGRDDNEEEGSRARKPVVQQNQDVKTTPRKKVRFTDSIVDEKQLQQTPTRGSRSLLELFKISSPSKTSFDQDSQDLIDLHAAFLNALAIHYAHNGTTSPIDLKALIPRIEKKWSRRRIEVEDIQRVLGILHTEHQSALSLAERTKGRVCVEYNQTLSHVLPLETLKKAFTRAIQVLVLPYPLETISIYIQTTNPILSKGAQRLADLQLSKSKPEPSLSVLQLSTPAGTASSRATNLLDRILAKEAHLSSLPAGPSAEALAEKAALQKLEEVIPILEVLTTSSSSTTLSTNRNLYGSAAPSLASLGGLGAPISLGPAPKKVVSFTMSALVQRLQGSMRHPISREECERAITLLGEVVAPKWCQIRGVGNVVGVVFRGTIGRREWMGRLDELLAEI